MGQQQNYGTQNLSSGSVQLCQKTTAWLYGQANWTQLTLCFLTYHSTLLVSFKAAEKIHWKCNNTISGSEVSHTRLGKFPNHPFECLKNKKWLIPLKTMRRVSAQQWCWLHHRVALVMVMVGQSFVVYYKNEGRFLADHDSWRCPKRVKIYVHSETCTWCFIAAATVGSNGLESPGKHVSQRRLVSIRLACGRVCRACLSCTGWGENTWCECGGTIPKLCEWETEIGW